MADIATIGLELDVSHLARSGQVAEGVLNKLQKGGKLTASEFQQLARAMGGTGTAAQESLVRVETLGRTLQQTQTHARATTQVFNQLRGGMASMAQAAIGQAVPGLTSVTSALGSFAIGSGPLVAVLGGLTAIAVAFNVITKEARETREGTKKAIEELERIRQSQRAPEDVIQGNINKVAAEARRLSRELDIRLGTGRPGEVALSTTSTAQLKAKFSELVAQVRAGETEIENIRADAQEKAAADAKRAAEQAERAWIEAADNAARVWQRFLGTSVTGTLSSIDRGRMDLRLFNQGVGQVGFTGREQELRLLLGNVLAGPNGRDRASVETGGGFLSGLGDSIMKQLDPKMLITNLATSGVNAFLGVVGDFVSGIFDSADEAERAFKMWLDGIRLITTGLQLSGRAAAEFAAVQRVNEGARAGGINVRNVQDLTSLAVFIAALENMAEQTRDLRELQKFTELIKQAKIELDKLNEAQAELNRSTAESEQLRILELEGRDAEALALRHEIELREAERLQLEASTIELIKRRQALEAEREEMEQIRKERERIKRVTGGIIDPFGREIRDSQDLDVRRLRAEGKDQEAAILEFQRRQERELEEARAAGRTEQFINELIAIQAQEFTKFMQQFAPAGLGVTAGVSAEQEIIRNVMGITETTAVGMVNIQRSILSVNQEQLLVLKFIAGQGGMTSTRSGPGTSESANSRSRSGRAFLNSVNLELGHLANQEFVLSGDASI